MSGFRDDLNERELNAVSLASLDYTGEFGLRNAKANLPYIKHSIAELRGADHPAGSGDSAIVITAGPSLYRKDPAKEIKRSGYKGTIIAIDAGLNYCLKNDLVPHYLVTLDPHQTYMIRWFGDPDFDKRKHDDYFVRQELDPVSAADERAKNFRQIDLVNKYGPRMKAVIATSIAENVTKRCLQAGMELYWWNPLYDDWNAPNSCTRRAHEMNNLPCMVGGGNVATAAWIFAHSILGKKNIALVGMDFGYAPGTALINTQRYYEMKEFFGEKDMAKGYIKVWNPYLKEEWFTDPTYAWYRHAFRDFVKRTNAKTYNCTGGGILFGDGIEWTSLDWFLKHHNPKPAKAPKARAAGKIHAQR
jgi:hypothetical protein